MSDEWSPDEALGTETFDQGDDAIEESSRLDREFAEGLEQDPSINPTLLVDRRELHQVGAEFEDPELLVTLEGGIDDPDGLDASSVPRHRPEDEEGWDLGAPLVAGSDEDGTD
ncbi:MAG TPA: hypothetical protein VL961_12535 [Acidimicrobiales bacterium]|nr:hypothetical protein [Acidimicrobiales bacterium]